MLTKEDLEQAGSFARYKDVDGDGVGYRTLPGTDHPMAAYFARGSGHNEKARTANVLTIIQEHGTAEQEVRDSAVVCAAS